LLGHVIHFLDLLRAVVGKTKPLERALLVEFVDAGKLVLPRDSSVRGMKIEDIDLNERIR
jgi:hypothetical protein